MSQNRNIFLDLYLSYQDAEPGWHDYEMHEELKLVIEELAEDKEFESLVRKIKLCESVEYDLLLNDDSRALSLYTEKNELTKKIFFLHVLLYKAINKIQMYNYFGFPTKKDKELAKKFHQQKMNKLSEIELSKQLNLNQDSYDQKKKEINIEYDNLFLDFRVSCNLSSTFIKNEISPPSLLFDKSLARLTPQIRFKVILKSILNEFLIPPESMRVRNVTLTNRDLVILINNHLNI